MSSKPINPVPEGGYNTVNPWIITEDALKMITFLEDIFDGAELTESRVPDSDGLILHSEVKIGDSIVMVIDSKEDWPATPTFLQVYVSDASVVLEKAKEAGSEIVTELSDAWYGEKISRFKDPWGNLWWVHELTKVVDWETEAEIIEQEFEDANKSGQTNYIYETLLEAMRNIK